MEPRTMIARLRDRLKTLALLQKKAKRARKSTIPQEERKALLDELGIKYPEWAHANVMERRCEITACLNFHHELRGSEIRHGVREDYKYQYEKYLSQLRSELVQA